MGERNPWDQPCLDTQHDLWGTESSAVNLRVDHHLDGSLLGLAPHSIPYCALGPTATNFGTENAPLRQEGEESCTQDD